jgi:chromate transport protein ChrA
MHRDLVAERHWIAEEEYRDGLALAQLATGPLAAQLGIYLGYVHYGITGATLCGLAFILPSFVMVVRLVLPTRCWAACLDAGPFLWRRRSGGGHHCGKQL